jgi:hypothetical protein
VLGILDILLRIRIRGSVPLTYRSRSDYRYFLQWLSGWRKKILYFFLTTFPQVQAHYLQSLTSCFKEKFCVKILFCKHYFSPLNVFIRNGKDLGPEQHPYLWLTDSDPGGPKTCGSGSRCPTLVESIKLCGRNNIEWLLLFLIAAGFMYIWILFLLKEFFYFQTVMCAPSVMLSLTMKTFLGKNLRKSAHINLHQ